MTRRKGAGDGTRDLLDVVGSDLLDFGRLIIAGMKMTTGDGEPADGVQFRQGREAFDIAGQRLKSAAPDDRWDGPGSRSYADQNTRQRVRTETMANADEAVSAVLVRESLQIKARRDTLDTQSDLLAKTSYATFPLQFIPRYGEAAKLAIESAALNAALQMSASALYGLHSEVSDNATELRQALGRYATVADGADPPGDALDFQPPPGLPDGGGPPNSAPAGPPLPAAGQAATAGGSARPAVDDAEEDTVTAEGARDGDQGERVAAEAGQGAGERAPAVPSDTRSPEDTNVGESVHVGG